MMSPSNRSTAKKFWIVLVLTGTWMAVGQLLDRTVQAAPSALAGDQTADSPVPDSIAKPAPGVRPTVRSLSARLYGGYLVVTGTVRNIVGDPTEWTVEFSGSIVGSASVRSDGSFVYVTIYNYSYGEVGAQALGPNGQVSLPAVTEVYE